MSSQARYPGLDGLRGLAALGVVAVHAWMYTENSHHGERGPLVDAVIGELRLGLMFFFVVSGFLLARPWVRAAQTQSPPPSLRRYARGRAARVLPAYLVALVGAFAILHGTGHPREVGWEALPVFAVFAQNQVPGIAGQLNPPTWSLAVEVGFYLLLPLLGWAFLRSRTAWRMLALCLAAIVAGVVWSGAGYELGWAETVTTSPPTFLPIFACGVAACVVSCFRSVSGRAAVALLAVGWLAVVANGWWHAPGGTGLPGHAFRDLPAGIGFAAIVLGLCARPEGFLDRAPIRYLGTTSYGIYLWHMPVMYFLLTRDLFPDRFVPAYLAVIVPSVVLGAVSWHVVERPFLRSGAARGRAPSRRPVPVST